MGAGNLSGLGRSPDRGDIITSGLIVTLMWPLPRLRLPELLILTAFQVAEKRFQAVILSEAKNLAPSIFKTMRDPSSSASKNGGLLRMTAPRGFSAACFAVGHNISPLSGLEILS
jgi:hypothetical protein